MKEMLKELQEFVNEMKSTSSLLEKKVIIGSVKDNKFITTALNYTYDPYKKYYVTSKNCKKNSAICDMNSNYDDIFDLFDDLNNRTYTGHDAIAMVNAFVLQHKEYEDLIFSIIDRNLELRASDSVINKVIPNLIPTFDVALATKYEPKFCDFENEEWLGSRKLDGVRCIIRKEEGSVIAYSRQGNEFTTLQKVIDDVAKIPGNFVLDGEICMMDEEGNEDFQGIMKQIKRKNHTMDNPRYVIFDYLSLKEFDTKVGTRSLISRLYDIEEKRVTLQESNILSVLPQIRVKDVEHLNDMIAEADEAGYEGIMLRKNVGYQGKRTKNLLKCKKFFDAEYIVESVDFDTHRVIRDGKEVQMPMLAQAYIMHKGYEVAVGSGWNQEQRIRYEANPEQLIGKTITVQYFEETKNQDGGISLRFPTVKHVFENGRNV
mgnify:CR=1 FL=1